MKNDAHMEVEVTIVGSTEDPVTTEASTYGDAIEAVGLSPEVATVLVDGRPVPDDGQIDTTEVTVLRLVHGG